MRVKGGHEVREAERSVVRGRKKRRGAGQRRAEKRQSMWVGERVRPLWKSRE